MAEEFSSTSAGLICPWCPGSVPIATCEHDPFTLQEQVGELKFRVQELERRYIPQALLRKDGAWWRT